MRKLTIVAALMALSSAAWADQTPTFASPSVWSQDVRGPQFLHPNSTNMINHLDSLGGWGTGPGATNFQIDFSFYILHAGSGIATSPVQALDNDPVHNYYFPDCGDLRPGHGPVPSPIPLPAGGGIEGTGSDDPGNVVLPSYTCDADNEDCHMLIVQGTTLFESGNTTKVGSNVQARCAITWDLTKHYPRQGHGEYCTSTDGGGFPLAALLFNADDMYNAVKPGGTGDLGHAIRFILKNSRISKGKYVHPANHGTSGTGENGASDTSADAIPYGSRLRLRGDYPIETYVAATVGDGGTAATASAKAILRTLQKYGMILSDGGNIPLTAETDHYTQHKWSEFGMNPDTQSGSHVMFGIKAKDFEVVYTGPTLDVSGDCTPTPPDFIFIDSYDY